MIKVTLTNDILKKIENERFSAREMSEQLISAYVTELLIMTERSFSEKDNDDVRKLLEEIRFEILSNYSKIIMVIS